MLSKKITLFFILIATVLFYSAWRINYMQNDDYIHYQTVQNFLSGDFTLKPYLTSTFYAQGLLGMGFSFIFGIGHLPALTALLALHSLYIFALILKVQLKKNDALVFFTVLLLLVNPLFIYSSLGFMTEIYSLMFFLCGLYYVYAFNKSNKLTHYEIGNLFFVLGFFVKQTSLLSMATWAIYLFLRRNYRYAVTQLALIVILGIYYVQFFPQTEQMHASHLILDNIMNIPHSLSLLYACLIYLAIFSLPLIVVLLLRNFTVSKRNSLVVCGLSILLAFGMRYMFTPTNIRHLSRYENGTIDLKFSPKNFPYLPNVFARDGFLPDSLAGNKYGFNGADVAFLVIERMGKLFAIVAVILLLVKKRLDFEEIFILLCLAFLVVSPKVYDRYLLILVPVILTSFIKHISELSKLSRLFLIFYVTLLGFLSYQFVQDFHFVNSYTWNRSKDLERNLGVVPNKIKSENSWVHLYPNTTRKWDYIFEFKGTEKQLPTDENYEILETHKVIYPLNIFKDPIVYLVKRKSF